MSLERELWILRHGKSDWPDDAMTDHDRPLAPRGIEASRRMGAHLVGIGRPIDRTLCSSALRARETLGNLEIGIGWGLDAEIFEDLYLATTGTLLDHVQRLSETVATALFIGHNPGLEDLVRLLVGRGSEEAAARLAGGLKTATLVRVAFELEWAEAGPAGARLLECSRPKDLD